jgi:hypothetical protein
MILWDTCREDFRPDGSLRDIYISPATLADWRAIYPLLRDFPAAEFSVNQVVQPPPATVDEAFEVRRSANPRLRFRVGRALVVFHFLSEEEIECDVSPQEIASPTDLDALLEFVRVLGDTTHKGVVIAPENGREHPFISYEPETGKFEHHDVAV